MPSKLKSSSLLGRNRPSPKKVFISYTHKDEKFKDELLTVLAELENQRVIKVWQDRRIEAGSDWREAIQNAMKTCKIAILLISSNFLASPFIRDEELPKLLESRIEKGLKVVPIIIRPCMWQDNPVISSIQVLPKDGKPVISFPKSNGRRDQVWVEIAQAIRRKARAFR